MITVTYKFETEAELLAFLQRAPMVSGNVLSVQTVPTTPTIATPHIPASDDDGPTNANPPAVDSKGLPWDARIHSDKKAQNADGSWRRRRNINDEFVNAVETELRARVASPMPTMPPVQPTMPPAVDMAAQFAALQAQQTAQQQPIMPPVQPILPATPTGPLDFNGFMQHIMPKLSAGMIDHAYLASVVQKINAASGKQFGSITDIAADPAAITFAQQTMQMEGRW